MNYGNTEMEWSIFDVILKELATEESPKVSTYSVIGWGILRLRSFIASLRMTFENTRVCP